VKKPDPKAIMPEVLPDPTRSLGPGGPRQRTLSHMNRLLAVTAAGAAIGACSKTQQGPTTGRTTIEVPPPPAESATPEDDTPPPAADRDASTGTGTGTGTEPIPEPTGYAVVDPMPPPARCAGLAQTVKAAKAKWKSKTVIEVRLGKPSMSGAAYDTKEAPNVVSATLKKKTITKDSVVLEIEITSTNPVYAYVGATCPGGPQHVGIAIGGSGPSGTLVHGTTPVVSLHDSW